MSNMTSTQTTGKSIAGALSLSQTAHVFATNTKTFVAVIPIIVAMILCQLTTKLSAQVVITPTSTNAVCATSCDGAIDLKITGGTAPYTYAWNSSGGTGGTAYKQITLCLTGPPGATNQTATGSCNPPTAITDAAINLCPGTYTVTVTDNTGATASTVQTITAGTLNVLQVATDASTTTCVSGCTGVIKVNASAGNAPYTYAWSGSAVTGDTRNGLCTGTYSVTVTDKAGCDSVLVYNIGPTPSPTITGSSICAGGSVVLTASGGTSYSWSTGGTGSTISVAPTGSTTYTVTATNAGCPTSTASYTVVVNSSLALTTTPTNVACNGGTTGSGLANPSGGTAPYTYAWNNTQTAATATGLGTGSYQVTVTDSKGCSNISTVTITEPTAITVTTTEIKPACGAVTGSATVNATGGAGTYTYAWSPPGTSGTTISGVSAGSYTVTVTDANSCTKSDIITISNNPAPSINTLTGTPPLCNNGTNGTAVTTANGGTGTLTYAWSNAPTNNTTTTSGLSAGTYVVTVTDANGCLAVSTVVITQPTAVAATSSFVNSNCGKPDGSVSVSPTGGTGAYTYTWSGAASGQTSPATGLLAGSYTATVSDANGCTTTTSATISTQSPGVASIAPTSVKCNGGTDGTASTSMTGGTPGFTYAWAPIGGTGQTATGLTAGTYSVTVTDLNGCTSTATASVTEPTVVTASTTATTAICTAATGTATVTSGGGTSPYAYLWNANSQTTTTASGLTAGTYSVTVTDFNGCTVVTTATVIGTNGAGAASVAVQSNVLCFGGTTGALTANMSGGTSPFTYAWTSSSTAQTATGLTLGSYTVTITDANGCQTVSSGSITEPTAIFGSTTSTDATCGSSNGSATVTGGGGTGTLTYTWDASANNQTTTTATGLASGSYVVTITDGNSCTFTTTAIVNDIAPGTASVTASTISCNAGNNGSATASVSGSTASSYTWNSGPTTQTINGLTAGTYIVTVTDNNGCQMISSVTITEPTAITSATSTTSAPCGTFTGTATVNNGGGTGSYTFTWSTPPGGTTQTISGLQPGVYTVTTTDANGCTKVDQANVSNSPAPVITSLTALALKCNGDNNGTATVVASGGNGTLTYVWSNGTSGVTTATGLTAGTYNVSVTDAGGCTTVSNVTITEPAAITGTINTTATTCGSANGSVTVAPAGGTTPFTYAWSGSASGQTTASATGLSAGIYSVTATDANGCTSSASATVNNLNGPVAVATLISNITCNGQNNGVLDVSNPSNGGTPPFTYLWSGSGGTSTTATNLSADTYTVTVTDFNGCTSTSTATITEPTAITSSTTKVDATCGNNNGSSTVVYGGGTGSHTVVWSDAGSQTTDIATGLSVGAYTVTITDGSGCSKTDVVAISNNPSPTISSLTTTPLLCNGASNGTATVVATGGTAPLTYAWSNGGPSGAAATTFGGLSAGIYNVTVTDAGGCAAVSTVTVTEPAPIVLGSSATDAICNTSNGTATVSVTSGGTGTFTYSWNTAAFNQTTAVATGLAAGTYVVVVTDGNSCTSSTTAIVGNIGAGTATASLVNDVKCNGGADGSVTSVLSGATVSTYLWSNNATTQTVTGLPAGSYTVVITDVNGCAANSIVSITEPTAITNTTSKTDATCGQNNGTASVTTTNGGAGGYIYTWNQGGASQSITGLAGGSSYTVTITDAAGCSKTDVVAVSAVPSVPISVSKSDLACNGANTGTATVNVTGTVTIAWSNVPSGTGATITGLAAGTYVVSVTDANGCTSVSTASITEPTALVPSVSSTQAACGQSNGTATVTNVTGGTAPYTYAWTPGGPGQTISGLSAGNYVVVITDDNGCTVSASATVNNVGGPVLTSITGTDNLCFGQSNGTATVTVTTGTGSTPYTYVWNGGTPAVTSSTSSTISGLAAGTYNVTITDANGCVLPASVTVTEPTVLATPTTSSSNAACGKSNGSATAFSSGGTGAMTYVWDNSTTGDNATGLSVGTYTVTVTDANGCSKSNTVTIGTSNGPVAVATGTAPLCNGGTNGTATVSATTATGTPPYTYSWSTGATTTTISSLVADSTYTATVTDSKGCSSVSTVTMGNPAPLASTASGYAALCGSNNGSTKVVVAGGTPAFTYSWSNGGVTDSISNLSAGTYTVAIVDANGCTTSSTAIVGTISSSILVVIPAQQTINAGEFVSITVSGGVTYTWSPGAGLNCTNCPNPVATPTVTTTYTVTAIDANGCTATAMMTVTVRQACDDESDVYIANIFSPNDDGKNDKLFVEGNGLTDIYWAIYDRWGNLLFEAFNQTSGWDGTRKGNPMESGTYVYYLRATCLKTNTEVRLKGNVTIVK
ncbi:MAG: gliding motility-associated C-terminal domain-containing protein [Bacteroidetes bacterium]|nr:gliding motility-associated C-terminal domain-containing protein [Bacteroidota bacterium]